MNLLTYEYLRLSYHELRAKDNLFNATMITNFEEKMGNVKVISQNIGRVLLNLYNNAFYVVNEIKPVYVKDAIDKLYEPADWVSTRVINLIFEM